jgi:16S rRNA processing protein RimM
VNPDSDEQNRVILGRISGLYGVNGWLKIYSYTRPRENIFSYSPWLIQPSKGSCLTREVKSWKVQGKGLITQFEDVNDRELARTHVGLDISIPKDDLPELAEDEYYWCNLIGLEVINQADQVLGKVVEIRETGANDVLVVQGEEQYLIPLLKGSVVRQVDQERGRMLVDWDGEYI